MKHTRIFSWFNKSISRIVLSVLIVFLSFIFLFIFFSKNYLDNLIQLRKDEIRRHAQIARNTVQPIIDSFTRDEIDRQSALTQMASMVGRMTYHDPTMRNYFFLVGYRGIVYAQPYGPLSIGESSWDVQDQKGKYLIRELSEKAQSDAGAGYVSYYYPPPGEDEGQQKISYVIGIDELEVFLGTGMYIEDIRYIFDQYIFSYILAIIILSSVTIALVILFLRPVSIGFSTVLALIKSITRHPDNAPDIPLSRFPYGSESYDILNAFKTMADSMAAHRRNLRNTDRSMSALLDNLPAMVYQSEFRREGIFLYVSEGAREVCGYEPEELTGNNLHKWVDYTYPEDRDRAWETVKKCVENDEVFKIDYRIIDKSGKLVELHEEGKGVRNAEGEVEFLEGIISRKDASG